MEEKAKPDDGGITTGGSLMHESQARFQRLRHKGGT
jgi:hypothetical protein